MRTYVRICLVHARIVLSHKLLCVSAILLDVAQPGHAPIRFVTISSALHGKFCTRDANPMIQC